MVGAKDILAVLEKIPGWKRVIETPDRVDELEKRAAALEEKLGDEWPPDVCRACGKRALRLYNSMPGLDGGPIKENWVCKECGMDEFRPAKPR